MQHMLSCLPLDAISNTLTSRSTSTPSAFEVVYSLHAMQITYLLTLLPFLLQRALLAGKNTTLAVCKSVSC